MYIYYFVNDAIKHDKSYLLHNNLHKSYDVRVDKQLDSIKIYNYFIPIKHKTKELYIQQETKHISNIYIFLHKCQLSINSKYSIIHIYYNNNKYNITFCFNNNIFIKQYNLHKDDIVIISKAFSYDYIHTNAIYLEDLSKRLCEDESLYFNLSQYNNNHQLLLECIQLITNELIKTIDSIYESNEFKENCSYEKHHLITNLNAKYAMESYIKDVKLPLYIDMFDKLQESSLNILEDYVNEQSLINISLKDILIQIFSKTLNEPELYDYLLETLSNKSLLEKPIREILDTLLKDVKISDNQHNLLKEEFLNEYRNGFIEMNCNPMTIGHVYLIRTALKFLEKNAPKSKLFILVVEKDSQSSNSIKFKTRFEIIQRVCERLQKESFIKITVVSNKNILIGDVFIGYQKADKNVQESYQGGTNAMKLFAYFLAPMLNVGYRFFGTEENDVTTNCYNEDAKKICPTLGIKVCILKRLSVKY